MFFSFFFLLFSIIFVLFFLFLAYIFVLFSVRITLDRLVNGDFQQLNHLLFGFCCRFWFERVKLHLALVCWVVHIVRFANIFKLFFSLLSGEDKFVVWGIHFVAAIWLSLCVLVIHRDVKIWGCHCLRSMASKPIYAGWTSQPEIKSKFILLLPLYTGHFSP